MFISQLLNLLLCLPASPQVINEASPADELLSIDVKDDKNEEPGGQAGQGPSQEAEPMDPVEGRGPSYQTMYHRDPGATASHSRLH